MPTLAFVGIPETLPPDSRENTGNFVHGYAARHLFTDWHDAWRGNTPNNIARIRERATHLGLVAATMLHANRVPGYIDGHAQLADFIEALDLPVVTFGFGCQAPLGATVAEAEVDPRSVRLLQVISAHAETLAVRGEFTADLARKYGVRNVEPVGCQSIYFATADKTVADFAHRDVHRRYAGSLTVSLDETAMIRMMMENGVDFVGQNDPLERAIVAGDVTGSTLLDELDNYRASGATRRALRDGRIDPNGYAAWIRDHFKLFHVVPEWVRHMRDNYDFAFGSRFHGNAAATMAGVPALWFVHDMRTKELCENFALPHVDFDTAQKTTDIDALRAECDYAAFFRRRPEKRAQFEGYLKRNGVLEIADTRLF